MKGVGHSTATCSNTQLSMKSVTFDGNAAVEGGAIRLYYATGDIELSRFTRNTASTVSTLTLVASFDCGVLAVWRGYPCSDQWETHDQVKQLHLQ